MKKFIPKLFSRRHKPQEASPLHSTKPVAPVLNFLMFIVEWNIFKIIFSAFEELKVPAYFIHRARGTATSEIIDLLGIGATDKAVITCIEQPGKIPELLQIVRRKLGANRPGAGIALTVPLSAINSPILQAFKQADEIQTGNRRSGGFPHALIYSVVNKGYSDEFMNTARKAGASGGTIMNARGKLHEGAVRFFGIVVQEEREVILMLTSKDKKDAILKAVSEAHGLDSKAQGLILSLPVDRAMSLSFIQEFNA